MIDGDPIDTSMFPADTAADDAAASAAEPASPAAPQSDGALQEVLAALNGINQRIATLEQRGGANTAPPAPQAPADATADLYANPAAFVDARATAAARTALDGFAGQLTPFLEVVAEGLAQRGTDAARTQFDSSIGAGAFDKLVADDLNIALSKIPPAQRANAAYVQAIAAGVLGGKMLSAEGQKEVRDVMAAARARPPSPVLLSGNRGAPSPDRLSDDDHNLIDRVRRSGIAVDEKAYLAGRTRARTEEAWGATWMNPPAPRRPGPPNGRGAA